MIILNNGHTESSPGGVFGGRTEYLECKRLQSALYEGIRASDPTLGIRLNEGKDSLGECKPDDMLFVLHKGTAMKNAPKSGAEIYVRENASADTQYEAYRLLRTLCPPKGFRYRGVHTVTEKSPFKTFRVVSPESSYIISAGFIDSAADNDTFDRALSRIAENTAREIVKIYKEKKNEDNG